MAVGRTGAPRRERGSPNIAYSIPRLLHAPARRLPQVSPPELLLRLVVPTAVASLRKFLEERGCHVDIASLRREHPGLLTFEEWLRRRGLDKRVLPPAGWAACTIA